MGVADTSAQPSRKVFVTLTELPLLIELQWPCHRSGSGADFWVLHGDIDLGKSEGLRARVAVAGLMTLEGEWASANGSLMAHSEKFEADMKSALAELEKKHAFGEGIKK